MWSSSSAYAGNENLIGNSDRKARRKDTTWLTFAWTWRQDYNRPPVAVAALRRGSSAARLLRLWVRIPHGAWMSVSCERCVLSGRGLCVGLITRPEGSYWMWRVWVWLWTSSCPTSGYCAMRGEGGGQYNRSSKNGVWKYDVDSFNSK